MISYEPDWLEPTSLEEAIALRGQMGDDVTVVAGGTFLGILMNQGFLAPTALLSLGRVAELSYISTNGDLRLGAMTTHRDVERSAQIRHTWPSLARAFSLVASPRVRNQATVGGVLADADYASDPPPMLIALAATIVARSPEGTREIKLEDFILGPYETALRQDELLTEIKVPRVIGSAVYRKFRSRSSEDRPCVAVAVARHGKTLRIVVGAVAGSPQYFPEICGDAEDRAMTPSLARAIAAQYAQRIDPLSDSRGSAEYRRRVIAVEVRRALEELPHD